jgi:hypothetical protein
MRALMLVLALLATVAPSHAAVFCVSTPTALNNALETAGSNGEDNEIRLTRGTIGPPPAGEAYQYQMRTTGYSITTSRCPVRSAESAGADGPLSWPTL